MGLTDSNFPFWENSFFLVRKNHLKSAVFCQSQRKLGWNFNNWKYFSKSFLQKMLDFGEILVFF